MEILIPKNFVDISMYKPIGDNQEVFGNADTDQAIIIELVSSLDDVYNNEIGEFHFTEIAKNNNCENENQVIDVFNLTEEDLPNFSFEDSNNNQGGSPVLTHGCVVLGKQHVSKGREESKNHVNLYLAVLRFPSIQTEILISFSDAVIINQKSSSHKYVLLPDTDNNEHHNEALVFFRHLIRSFKVSDWSIFNC
eukprot:TRINITY_DN666_c0_g2_i2.p1 TRINITY_DN666_c0_g2~~TRINITY_DN666_c0_g2_i2.p1  ORF type:complete len:194 (-),score=62.05 TRINITY_DN666_c0_g2_i2:52-633(-)